MSAAETVVSTLKAKLILDASGFTSVADSISKQFGISWGGAANGLKKVGAVATTAAADAAKAAMTYETAFASIKKTVDAPIGKDAETFFKDLNDQILDTTKVMPVTAVELANIYAIAGQLGIPAENLKEFSDSMVMMASATNLTSEEAANAFARFGNVVHMDPTNFSNLGSSVVQLGNNMAVSEKEIAEYTQRLALMGHMMGMKESDVVALGATIASLGLESASSSTAMIRFTNQVTSAVATFTGTSSEDLEMFAHISEMTEDQLLALSDATGLTKSELKSLGEDYADAAHELSYFAEVAGRTEEFAGITEEAFAQLWQTDATKALEAFFEGFDTMANDEQITYLQSLEIEQVNEQNVLRSLASGHELLSGALDMSSEAWDSNTAMTTEADAAFGTTASQVQLLQNNVDLLAISLGTTLLPVIQELVKDLTPFLESVGNFIKDHPDLSKNALILGVALGIIGNAMSIMAPLIKAFGKEGQLASVGTALKEAVPHIKEFASTLMAKAVPAVITFGQTVSAFIVANPFVGWAVAIVAVIGLLAWLSTSLDEIEAQASATAEQIANIDTSTQTVVENRLGQFEVVEYEYSIVTLPVEGTWDQYYEAEVRYDEGSRQYVTREEDLANAASSTVSAIEGQTAALAGQQTALETTADTISENAIGDQLTETMEQPKSAFEQAQELLDQMNVSLGGLTDTTDGFGTAWDESMTGLNELMESEAFQQFASQPIDPAVAESWDTFAEAVDKTVTGFGMIQNSTGFTELPVIPGDVIESYKALADAIQAISKTLVGGAGEETGEEPAAPENAAAVGGEEGTAGMNLMTALQNLPDMFLSVLAAATQLTDYFNGPFQEAVGEAIKVLCKTGVNDKGEVTTGGGNTLYTAAGAVKGVFEDIVSATEEMIKLWNGPFTPAVNKLKEACGIAEGAAQAAASAATDAAVYFNSWADAIERVIGALKKLGEITGGGANGGGSGFGFGFGGFRALGGEVGQGKTFVVGEEGPELFVPKEDGYIISNDELEDNADMFIPHPKPGGEVGNEILEDLNAGSVVIINFNGDVIGDEESISGYVENAARTAMMEEIYAAL